MEFASQPDRVGLLSEKLRRPALRWLAVGLAIGALAEAEPTQAKVAPLRFDSSPVPSLSQTDAACTRIQSWPRGFYLGKACADNSRLIKEHESFSRRYDYGIIVVNGVYKCGWVLAGIIPTRNPKHRPKDCQQAYGSMHDPYNYYEKLNCRPGECGDGAPGKFLKDSCDDTRFFANFATDKKSIFNLHPHGNSGLSDSLGEQYGPVHYRGKTRLGSDDGKAALVRSNRYHWGFTQGECASVTHGGPDIKVPADN